MLSKLLQNALLLGQISLYLFTTARPSHVGLQLFFLRSVNSPRDGQCLIHLMFVVHLVQWQAQNVLSLFIEFKINR